MAFAGAQQAHLVARQREPSGDHPDYLFQKDEGPAVPQKNESAPAPGRKRKVSEEAQEVTKTLQEATASLNATLQQTAQQVAAHRLPSLLDSGPVNQGLWGTCTYARGYVVAAII